MRRYITAAVFLVCVSASPARADWLAPSSTPGIRPYASGGQFSDRAGVRADIRYFRSVQDSAGGDDIDIDLGGFNFWRGTLGVTFRF